MRKHEGPVGGLVKKKVSSQARLTTKTEKELPKLIAGIKSLQKGCFTNLTPVTIRGENGRFLRVRKKEKYYIVRVHIDGNVALCMDYSPKNAEEFKSFYKKLKTFSAENNLSLSIR